MAKKTGIIGYGLAFGVGLGLGYLMFSQQPVATAPRPPDMAANGTVGTRWTSGYHGSFAAGFPEAGVAEQLYPTGQYSKMTSFSPASTTAGVSGATANGTLVYID